MKATRREWRPALAPTLLLAAFCSLALSTVTARADAVVITSGSMDIRRSADVGFTLRGPGLTLVGTTHMSSAGHYYKTFIPFSQAGRVYDLSSRLDTSTPDLGFLGGQTVLRGISYPVICCSSADGTMMWIAFNVPPATIPVFPDASGFVVTAPFTANGIFNPNQTRLPGEPISGEGTAQFWFVRDPNQPDVWRLDQVQFTFGQRPADVSVHATPEPAAMLLLGTGLAGALGAARRRRKASRAAADERPS